MGEAKQQTKRPPWIVDLPSDDPDGKRSFTIACRGSVALGEALHYFTLAASYEVADGKANKSDKTISVKRMGDTIAKYLGVSKKTAIDYTRTLAEWKFLILHSYQHSYEVCHHAVEDAIKNPPEKEYPKPRGRHVKREDCKSTISPSKSSLSQKKRIEHLEGQISELNFKMLDLHSEISNLRSQMFNLQSSQFHQGASEAGADTQNSPYILLTITKDITRDSNYDAANADVTGPPVWYSHPEYSFVEVNDLETPSEMRVTLTPAFPHPFFSEMEDKRRERVVDAVMAYFRQKGCSLEIQWLYEKTGTPSSLSSSVEEEHYPNLNYLEGENRYDSTAVAFADSDVCELPCWGPDSVCLPDFVHGQKPGELSNAVLASGLATQSGRGIGAQPAYTAVPGGRAGHMEAQAAYAQSGTSANIQAATTQTQTPLDSYSQTNGDTDIPSVFFLETKTALEVDRASDSDTHSHCANDSNADPLSKNAQCEAANAEPHRPDRRVGTTDVLRAAATQATSQEIATQGATNGVSVNGDYSAARSDPGSVDRDGASDMQSFERYSQPGTLHDATGGHIDGHMDHHLSHRSADLTGGDVEPIVLRNGAHDHAGTAGEGAADGSSESAVGGIRSLDSGDVDAQDLTGHLCQTVTSPLRGGVAQLNGHGSRVASGSALDQSSVGGADGRHRDTEPLRVQANDETDRARNRAKPPANDGTAVGFHVAREEGRLDGPMGISGVDDGEDMPDPAHSGGADMSRSGEGELAAAGNQSTSAGREPAQSPGHRQSADVLRRDASGQRRGRADKASDEAVAAQGNRRKAKKEDDLSPEERERWRKWKKIIVDNRGGELQDQGKIINETEEIKKVLARFNDAQLHKIWWYMTTQHFKWSKPDFKHTIGGYVLNHEANGIKKTLEELRKWPEDSIPGKPLSPGTWETSPPVARTGTGYQNLNVKMAALAKQFAGPRGE